MRLQQHNVVGVGVLLVRIVVVAVVVALLMLLLLLVMMLQIVGRVQVMMVVTRRGIIVDFLLRPSLHGRRCGGGG